MIRIFESVQRVSICNILCTIKNGGLHMRKMGKHIEHTNVTMHFHLAIRMILIFREKNMKKCL